MNNGMHMNIRFRMLQLTSSIYKNTKVNRINQLRAFLNANCGKLIIKVKISHVIGML